MRAGKFACGLLFAGIAITALAKPVLAGAETENFTFTGTPVQNAGGEPGVTSTSFAEFDPSLGTLSSIMISISGDATLSDASGIVTVSADDVTPASDVHQNLVSANGSASSDGSFPISANGTDAFPPDLALFEGTGTAQLVFDFDGSGGTVSLDNVPGTLTYNFTPTSAVPEPASIALLGVAMAGFGFVKWRRAA
jgi:PEP-CTERM motif-containing protein